MPFMNYLTRHTVRVQPTTQKRKEIGDYWLGKTVGRGVSGRVKLGIHKYTGERVAIKIIARSKLASSNATIRSVQRELAILQLLHHPHLVELRHVLQDSTNVYFVTEYMAGGELFHLLTERGRFPEAEARTLFRQIIDALAWCHAHHICHRDLKPENILLDKEKKNVKLADFGMAAIQTPDSLLTTSCGSPHYASPEIVRGKSYDGLATDVWSCGAILYALLTGYLPFDDDNMSRLLQRIKSGKFRPLPNWLSSEAKDLIQRMLSVDPTKRITVDAILVHPWLTDKSFLGTDLRFPSLQLFPSHNPLDDQGLDLPLISNQFDLDGRIWETLKVLWLNLRQEEVLAALTSRGSNIQKLTCRLLQRRIDQLDDPETKSVRKPAAVAADDMPPPYIQHSGSDLESKCSLRTPYGSSIDTVSCCCRTIDLPPTPSSTTFDMGLCDQECPSETFKIRSWNKCGHSPDSSANQKLTTGYWLPKPHLAWVPSNNAQTLKSNAILSVAPAYVQAQFITSNPVRRLRQQQKSSRKHLSIWQKIVSNFFKASNPTFSLICVAKHECEAAGKIHQILEERFGGRLCGRIYPDGQIVWKGTMLTTQELRFLCHVDPFQSCAYQRKIQIILTEGDPHLFTSAMTQLLEVVNAYEYDANEVAAANGWKNINKRKK